MTAEIFTLSAYRGQAPNARSDARADDGRADGALKIRGAATALTAGTTKMCGALDRLTHIPRSHLG